MTTAKKPTADEAAAEAAAADEGPYLPDWMHASEEPRWGDDGVLHYPYRDGPDPVEEEDEDPADEEATG